VILLRCLQHGPMRHDEALGEWSCDGWAGEGCLTAMIIPDIEADLAILAGTAPPGTEWIVRAA
jgi:hypothetical protein